MKIRSVKLVFKKVFYMYIMALVTTGNNAKMMIIYVYYTYMYVYKIPLTALANSVKRYIYINNSIFSVFKV